MFHDTIVTTVTPLSKAGDRATAVGAGFDSYVGKPISAQHFVQDIETILPVRVRGAPFTEPIASNGWRRS